MKKVLFPGSFDPFTRGHADIVGRGLALFDEVIIAVGYNVQKPGWINVEERVRALRTFYAGEPRIRVEQYSGLTVDFAQTVGATALLRGVRNTQDFDYEQLIAQVNRQLTGLDTVLLFADPALGMLSSSMVRELAHFGRDISEFLPEGLDYNMRNIQPQKKHTE